MGQEPMPLCGFDSRQPTLEAPVNVVFAYHIYALNVIYLPLKLPVCRISLRPGAQLHVHVLVLSLVPLNFDIVKL